MQRSAHLEIAAALAALTLILAGCGGGSTPAGPNLDATETRSALDSVVADASALFATAGQSDAVAALATFIPHDLPSTPGILPRGRYDRQGDAWVLVGESDQLMLTWPTDEQPPRSATLEVDWDTGRAPVTVELPGVGPQEVPQDALATLQLDGVDSGRLQLAASWRDTACGPLLEPTELRLAGYLGEGDNRVTLGDLSFSLEEAGPVTSIVTTGDVSATTAPLGPIPGADLGLTWDLTVDGAASRDPNACSLTDFVVQDGHIGFELGAMQHDLAFLTDFANVRHEGGVPTAVELSGGRLEVDGALAVAFEGTLDDADQDGTPGDNLNLTFRDGVTMTLEAFLDDLLHLFAAGAR